MKSHSLRTGWQSDHSGFTLVELMVAIAAGLSLVAMITSVYLGNREVFRTQEQNAMAQESGRFLLEFMARDIRSAGYLGCSSRPDDGTLPVINYLNSTSWLFSVERGVLGYEAIGTAPGDSYAITQVNPAASGDASAWSPALPGGTYALSGLAVPGSDVLVITSVDDGAIPLISPFTSGSQIFVQTPHDLAIGDILLVSDCQQEEIFQATNINNTGINIVGSNSGAVLPGNRDNIAERGPVGPFQAGSEVVRIRSYAYYIGVGANGTPSLFRQRLNNSGSGTWGEELISDADSLQVLYGIDSNLDYVIDNYVTAAAVADWYQVRAVQIGLLVRTPDNILPLDEVRDFNVIGTTLRAPSDRRQRRVFNSTIALRNRLL